MVHSSWEWLPDVYVLQMHLQPTAHSLLTTLHNTGTERKEVVTQSTAQTVLVDLIMETSFPEKLAMENIYFCCRIRVSLI